MDKFSVIFELTPTREDDESRVLLLILLLLVMLLDMHPVRSVPRMLVLEERVEKLDGLELEKPFSSSVLISVDGRYW